MNETARALSADYDAKTAEYFAQARREWIDPLPVNPTLAILELGCGAGATGALALRTRKCGTYVGIEAHAPAARQAQFALTEVHVGDVADLDLPYEAETFDLLICGDVLEHLTDPARVLKRLAPLLKTGGRVIVSTPNIAHWQIVLGLIAGRFDYASEGVMDATHLKWFTPRSLRALFIGAGLRVDSVRPLGWKRISRWVTALVPMNYLLWRQIDARGRRPWRT